MRTFALTGDRRYLAPLILPIALASPGATPVVTTTTSPGEALPVFRNSHATAVGCWAHLVGIREPGESDEALIGSAAAFLQFCDCDKPRKPTLWRVAEGVQDLLLSRGRTAEITERARYSAFDADRVTFDEYATSIQRNRPVIVTLCYDPDARESLAAARRRVSECTSMVGVGYVEAGGEKYLLCHDGLPAENQEPAADRVRPESLHLDRDSLCSKSGTSLYRWDGHYANLVLAFVTLQGP